MEKEGRPPENKRSRKPAHPVKREINEEMKVSDRYWTTFLGLRMETERSLKRVIFCGCVKRASSFKI